jgi:hypothetical protein
MEREYPMVMPDDFCGEHQPACARESFGKN